MPGIKIDIENDILTVSGEHEEHKEEKDKHFPAPRAPLRLLLPFAGSARGRGRKKIKASTHDGVVEVTIPLPSESKKEKVEIKPTAA